MRSVPPTWVTAVGADMGHRRLQQGRAHALAAIGRVGDEFGAPGGVERFAQHQVSGEATVYVAGDFGMADLTLALEGEQDVLTERCVSIGGGGVRDQFLERARRPFLRAVTVGHGDRPQRTATQPLDSISSRPWGESPA